MWWLPWSIRITTRAGAGMAVIMADRGTTGGKAEADANAMATVCQPIAASRWVVFTVNKKVDASVKWSSELG